MLFKNVFLATTTLVSHVTLISGSAIPDEGNLVARQDGTDNVTSTGAQDAFVASITEDHLQEVERVFDLFDQIPDDVDTLPENDARNYLTEYFNHVAVPPSPSDAPSGEIDERSLLAPRDWWQIAKCAWEIGVGLAGAFPPARIFRIKAIIHAMGGAKKAATQLIKAGSIAEARRLGGPLLVELIDILINFQGVATACF
jgi:hypothetical protein